MDSKFPLIFVFLTLAALLIGCEQSEPNSQAVASSVNTSNQQHSATTPVTATQAQRCQDIDGARKAYAVISEGTIIQEWDDHASYTFHAADWVVVRPRLSETVHAIADLDACLKGKSRKLDFYSLDGKLVAYADPSVGIHILLD